MSLRHAALGLLAQSPGSGYDLLKRFEHTLAHVWPATQSQLYTELGRLEAQGLIEVAGTGARNRKEYAITAAGRDELQEWLRHPVREVPRDANLLQVFLLGEVDADVAAAHLAELEGRAREHLAALQSLDRSIAWDDSARDRYARLALDSGIRQRRAITEWAADAQGAVRAHEDDPSR